MGDEMLRPGKPLGELNAENLQLLMEDMGVGPGWHPSARLYRWYEGMCQEGGLTPVSAKRFGMVLRELGHTQRSAREDGRLVRGWFIKAKALRVLPPREQR